tara:strand:+ start:306 stop:503 length:198 start_codon:yes stop_codon:yes gene_type:complete
LISGFVGPVELSAPDLLRILKWYNLALNKQKLDSDDEDTIIKIRAMLLTIKESQKFDSMIGSKPL